MHPFTWIWVHTHRVTKISTAASDEAYYYALYKLWAKGRFILIEQDIVPPKLKEMWNCPYDWCTHPYYADPKNHMGYLAHGLGCVKFSQRLMQRYPTLLDDIPKGWKSLDAFVVQQLHNVGLDVHVHFPEAMHCK